MEISTLVSYINKQLAKGMTEREIEKKIKIEKNSIRNELNKAGYVYINSLNAYVLTGDNTICYNATENKNKGIKQAKITHNNNIGYRNIKKTYNPLEIQANGEEKMDLREFKELTTKEQVELINKYADGILNLKDIEKKYFTFTNINKYIDRKNAFWDGQQKKYILIKKEELSPDEINFIKMLYKQHKIKLKIEADVNLNQSDIITRSIRVEKTTINKFALFCKENNLNQATALTKALEDFMLTIENQN